MFLFFSMFRYVHQSEACTHQTESHPQPGCVGWYREWQKKLQQRFFLINGPLSVSLTVRYVLNIVPTNDKYVEGTCPTNPPVWKPVVYNKFHSNLSLNPFEFFWPMLKTLSVQWENSELGPLKLEEYWCRCFLSRLIVISSNTAGLRLTIGSMFKGLRMMVHIPK